MGRIFAVSILAVLLASSPSLGQEECSDDYREGFFFVRGSYAADRPVVLLPAPDTDVAFRYSCIPFGPRPRGLTSYVQPSGPEKCVLEFPEYEWQFARLHWIGTATGTAPIGNGAEIGRIVVLYEDEIAESTVLRLGENIASTFVDERDLETPLMHNPVEAAHSYTGCSGENCKSYKSYHIEIELRPVPVAALELRLTYEPGSGMHPESRPNVFFSITMEYITLEVARGGGADQSG